jgi:hypothetical protein
LLFSHLLKPCMKPRGTAIRPNFFVVRYSPIERLQFDELVMMSALYKANTLHYIL